MPEAFKTRFMDVNSRFKCAVEEFNAIGHMGISLGDRAGVPKVSIICNPSLPVHRAAIDTNFTALCARGKDCPNLVARQAAVRECKAEGKTKKRLDVCNGSFTAYYCDRACQKAHFPEHQRFCKQWSKLWSQTTPETPVYMKAFQTAASSISKGCMPSSTS